MSSRSREVSTNQQEDDAIVTFLPEGSPKQWRPGASVSFAGAKSGRRNSADLAKQQQSQKLVIVPEANPIAGLGLSLRVPADILKMELDQIEVEIELLRAGALSRTRGVGLGLVLLAASFWAAYIWAFALVIFGGCHAFLSYKHLKTLDALVNSKFLCMPHRALQILRFGIVPQVGLGCVSIFTSLYAASEYDGYLYRGMAMICVIGSVVITLMSTWSWATVTKLNHLCWHRFGGTMGTGSEANCVQLKQIVDGPRIQIGESPSLQLWQPDPTKEGEELKAVAAPEAASMNQATGSSVMVTSITNSYNKPPSPSPADIGAPTPSKRSGSDPRRLSNVHAGRSLRSPMHDVDPIEMSESRGEDDEEGSGRGPPGGHLGGPPSSLARKETMAPRKPAEGSSPSGPPESDSKPKVHFAETPAPSWEERPGSTTSVGSRVSTPGAGGGGITLPGGGATPPSSGFGKPFVPPSELSISPSGTPRQRALNPSF